MSDELRSGDLAAGEPTELPPREATGLPFLRICANIGIVILMGGCLQYWLDTRVQTAPDEAWTGSDAIVSGATYRDAEGITIIAKGDRFLAAADRPDADTSHVEQLRNTRHVNVRVVSHETFSGLPDALRWAAASVSSVGYADRRPTTGPGRLLAATLMFISASMLSALAGMVLSVAIPSIRRMPKDRAVALTRAGAATLVLTTGHLLPPMHAALWFKLDAGALGIVLGALLWLALLAVAIGVYRGSHVCALAAFAWWIAGGGIGLYAPSALMATLHTEPPSVYGHAAWVVGAALMSRLYIRAVTHYVPARRNRA